MSKKTEEIRKRVKLREEKLGRKLKKNERRKIEKSVISKYRRQNFRRAILLAFGIGAGAGAIKLIDAGNYTGVEVDKNAIEIDASDFEDITIDKLQDDKEVFLNDLKVTVNDVEKISTLEEVENAEKSQVLKEIDDLIENVSNPEDGKKDFLDYIKQFYVDKYNEMNASPITLDNIEGIYKYRDFEKMFRSKAENGDKIIKSVMGNVEQGDLENKEIIKIILDKDGERNTEKATYDKGNYVKVYDVSEESIPYYIDDTVITSVAGIFDKGIDIAETIGIGERVSLEKKKELAEKIIEERAEKSNEDFEIGD